jgi:hypothetical protein
VLEKSKAFPEQDGHYADLQLVNESGFQALLPLAIEKRFT